MVRLVSFAALVTALLLPLQAQAWDDGICGVLDPSMLVAAPGPTIFDSPATMCELAGPSGRAAQADGPVLVDEPDAAAALDLARQLHGSGRYDEALRHLAVVLEGYPSIEDRIALLRGQILLDTETPRAACAEFTRALRSPDSSVRAHARVGRVRCLIRSGHRLAASSLVKLIQRYPSLPGASALRYELARWREEHGQIQFAVSAYRDIDLKHPGWPIADRSLERLEALRARGIFVRRLTREQRVDRAVRLARRGPTDSASREIDALLADRFLTRQQRARLSLSAAFIARVEGRWRDAQRHMETGQEAEPDNEAARRRLEAAARDMAAAAGARQDNLARRRIRELKGWRPWENVTHARLLSIVGIAARAGLHHELNRALEALSLGRRVPNSTAFDAAVIGAGEGSDEWIASLFGRLIEEPRYQVSARYHYGRALERMGLQSEAEEQYLEVLERDQSATRYYAMWAQQRLAAARGIQAEPVLEAEPEDDDSMVCMVAESRPRPAKPGERSVAKPELAPVSPPAPPNLPNLVDALGPVIEAHGDFFPWLARARDLLRLGDTTAAADELHEAYLAWRDATGRHLRRVGLESVYRGLDRPRPVIDPETRAGRRLLDLGARRELAAVCAALGDAGTAVGFGGWAMVQERPRAYEPIVLAVAARHGLDPNLLFAVMRVESVYQRRIVSYAGAVGLMQIMPRTGQLIAKYMGRESFTVADLLDPETNIEFAAWYLASLLRRFDGRLPLAIASYNGGPHNVRRWLRDHGENMPLDAFLERIPFSQTRRYVRRVLTHYAAYRRQQGLEMAPLSVAMPTAHRSAVNF